MTLVVVWPNVGVKTGTGGGRTGSLLLLLLLHNSGSVHHLVLSLANLDVRSYDRGPPPRTHWW
jgi:hypothetical protein